MKFTYLFVKRYTNYNSYILQDRGRLMLISNLKTIGVCLRTQRKKLGMTQAEVAEAALLSDRAYADIERGISNPRLETFLKICNVLQITPNDILFEKEEYNSPNKEEAILKRLFTCSSKEKNTAFQLLTTYLNSLD